MDGMHYMVYYRQYQIITTVTLLHFQTLLHSMKSPLFKKSLIQVESDSEEGNSEDENDSTNSSSDSSLVCAKDATVTEYNSIPIKLRMKRKFAESNSCSGQKYYMIGAHSSIKCTRIQVVFLSMRNSQFIQLTVTIHPRRRTVCMLPHHSNSSTSRDRDS